MLIKGKSVEKILRDLKDNSLLWTNEGMIQISLQRIRYLFESPLTRIQDQLKNILGKIKDVTQIFFVGGFLNSAILRDDVQFSLGQKYELIIPKEPETAILRGMQVYAKTVIQPPLLRSPTELFQVMHSYGVAILRPFVVGEHPDSKRVYRHNRDWCVDIWDCLLRTGDVYYSGYTLRRMFTTASSEQRCVKVNFYRWKPEMTSSSANSQLIISEPAFISDPGVRFIGQLVIRLSKSSQKRNDESYGAKLNRQSSFAGGSQRSVNHEAVNIQAEFQFHSENHITFRAKNVKTNESLSCSFQSEYKIISQVNDKKGKPT